MGIHPHQAIMQGMFLILGFFLTGFTCNTISPSPREARGIDISTLVKLRMAVGASNSTNSTRKFPKKPMEIPLICMGSRVLKDMEYVVIETENYPGQYPRDTGDKFPCMWDFIIPQNAAVFISCESFDLKKGDTLYIGGINQNHR